MKKILTTAFMGLLLTASTLPVFADKTINDNDRMKMSEMMKSDDGCTMACEEIMKNPKSKKMIIDMMMKDPETKKMIMSKLDNHGNSKP